MGDVVTELRERFETIAAEGTTELRHAFESHDVDGLALALEAALDRYDPRRFRSELESRDLAKMEVLRARLEETYRAYALQLDLRREPGPARGGGEPATPTRAVAPSPRRAPGPRPAVHGPFVVLPGEAPVPVRVEEYRARQLMIECDRCFRVGDAVQVGHAGFGEENVARGTVTLALPPSTKIGLSSRMAIKLESPPSLLVARLTELAQNHRTCHPVVEPPRRARPRLEDDGTTDPSAFALPLKVGAALVSLLCMAAALLLLR